MALKTLHPVILRLLRPLLPADSLPTVVLNHPTGNANSRAVLEGLCNASLLKEFHTCVATYPWNMWSMLARTSVGQEFARRCFAASARAATRQQPWRELGRMLAIKARLGCLTRHETAPFCIDEVYRGLDRKVARGIRRRPCDAVYAYEDGALETFRTAQSMGIKCLYDLPIGYWRAARKLLESEQQRWPEWASTMPGFQDSQAKLARKDEELLLADRIYVASQFTRRTLESYPGTLAPIEVIPYGYPAAGQPRDYAGLGHRKLRLLFVGGLSQRKGIADVFAVADELGDAVELTVIGNGPVDRCPALATSLARHRWIPSLPHAKVIETMRQHDVLLFPSLFEGFGLVVTEAMSQGTPVITTDRTAGGDIIDHGSNGWLVEAASTAALKQQVEQLLSNTATIAECGEQARLCATHRSWASYGRELAESIHRVLLA